MDIKYIDSNTIRIKIFKDDYNRLLDLKTSYDIVSSGYEGLISVIRKINYYKYIIIFIVIGLITLFLLSRIIFSIDIITNDKDMKKILLDELNNNGLEIYHFKKDYNSLQVIKNNILNKYRDKIDWLEIENIGTKYIVRYEPRINNSISSNNGYRHIIALKNSIIYSMDITSGQIVKGRNDYVKKGDIIVSGYITLNDSVKNTVSSSGTVLGEVWYMVSITYPLRYQEEVITSNSKNVFVIKFLNKNIELFNFKHYKYKRVNNKILFKNNILPISFIRQHQMELKVVDEDNSYEEATNKAIDMATKKIEDNLSDNEFILNKKVIGSYNDSESVTVKIFFSVVEDITDYQNIEEFKTESN